MKKRDKGSLTAREYEQIFCVLNEYCRIVDNIDEPFYIKDVRKGNLNNVHKIMKKMRNRMNEFPNSFAC